MSDFVKLYGSILDSSVWATSKDTRLVWITMMAMANRHGIVEASVGGLARRAGVTREECEAALEVLSSPDEDDKSGVDEGRRIRKVERGWHLTNHATYRELRTDTQVKTAERVRNHRGRKAAAQTRSVTVTPVTLVTPNNAPSRHVRADRDRERDQDQETKPEIARARDAAPPPPALAKGTAHERATKSPRNPAEAAELPINDRAFYVEQNRHLSEWVTPEAWPEVRAVAQAVHEANGLTGTARLLPYAKDSGVRAVVALFAAGFALDELLAAVRGVTKSKWWRSEDGKPRSLGALSVEVIRREQAGARETQLTPHQLERIARAKHGLNADPNRPGPKGAPSLLATVLPPFAASGGES